MGSLALYYFYVPEKTNTALARRTRVEQKQGKDECLTVWSDIATRLRILLYSKKPEQHYGICILRTVHSLHCPQR